jgi:tRNA (guanine37-N1)-methyltransferase
MFEGFIGESILKIAQEKGLVKINLINIRDFSTDKHKKVDAPPYGGGPGMVIRVEPVFSAVEYLRSCGREKSKLIILTPQGKPYNQKLAIKLAKEKGLIILCGHYEGFDERIIQGLSPLEISIGDYILTGGESACMAILDSVVRLVPGALGNPDSLVEDSFAKGMLKYPQYTRPEEFKGMRVPDILLSGDHAKIKQWREKEAHRITQEKRPDLLKKKDDTDY